MDSRIELDSLIIQLHCKTVIVKIKHTMQVSVSRGSSDWKLMLRLITNTASRKLPINFSSVAGICPVFYGSTCGFVDYYTWFHILNKMTSRIKLKVVVIGLLKPAVMRDSPRSARAVKLKQSSSGYIALVENVWVVIFTNLTLCIVTDNIRVLTNSRTSLLFSCIWWFDYASV